MHSLEPPYAHNDVKPGNVLITHRKGQPPLAILMDFGSARPARRQIRSRSEALQLQVLVNPIPVWMCACACGGVSLTFLSVVWLRKKSLAFLCTSITLGLSFVCHRTILWVSLLGVVGFINLDDVCSFQFVFKCYQISLCEVEILV